MHHQQRRDGVAVRHRVLEAALRGVGRLPDRTRKPSEGANRGEDDDASGFGLGGDISQRHQPGDFCPQRLDKRRWTYRRGSPEDRIDGGLDDQIDGAMRRCERGLSALRRADVGFYPVCRHAEATQFRQKRRAFRIDRLAANQDHVRTPSHRRMPRDHPPEAAETAGDQHPPDRDRAGGGKRYRHQRPFDSLTRANGNGFAGPGAGIGQQRGGIDGDGFVRRQIEQPDTRVRRFTAEHHFGEAQNGGLRGRAARHGDDIDIAAGGSYRADDRENCGCAGIDAVLLGRGSR